MREPFTLEQPSGGGKALVRGVGMLLLLVLGIKESARFNNAIVFMTISSPIARWHTAGLDSCSSSARS